MKATITRDVDTFNVLSSPGQATAPALSSRELGTIKGDKLVRTLLLSYDATISGTSTPTRVTNGHIFYANTITLESDKQKNIVDNMDGLSLYKLLGFDQGTPGTATALTSTPADSDTPACSWEIPFALRKGIRPYDAQIDCIAQVLTMKVQFGATTNLWTQSGGTPLVVTNTQTVVAKIIDGPIQRQDAVLQDGTKLFDERPIYSRYFGQKADNFSATETRRQVAIPFGNTIYRRIMLEQRKITTKEELTTVVAATGRVTLEINNVPFISNVRFRDVQRFNKGRYSLESLFTGTAVLDFDADDQEKIDDMLKVLTTEQGSAYLYVDVVYTNSTDTLVVSYDALRQINPDARG